MRGGERARALGYPTVNIPINEHLSGVFVARVHAGGALYEAAAFADSARKLLEAHLLDYSGELYGEEVLIELLHKIRESEKFDDDELLKAKIAADVESVRAYLKTH